MQKTAQDTQPQIGNPDTARRIYAFATARINPDWISLKVWLLGGVIRARNIAVAALPDLIAQIDAALADGCEVITLDGAEFSAPEKVLSGIKKEFSYCCLGASDGASRAIAAGATSPTAVFSSEKNLRSSPSNFCSIRGDSAAQALGSSANAQLTKGATRTVRGAKQISEAAAQKASASSARQFNNHPKSGRRSFNAGSKSPAAAAVPISSGVRDSRRESRAVSCLREASISRCGGVKKARRPDTEKSPKPSGVAAEGNQIRTKHGRTSVVVATRNVS